MYIVFVLSFVIVLDCLVNTIGMRELNRIITQGFAATSNEFSVTFI